MSKYSFDCYEKWWCLCLSALKTACLHLFILLLCLMTEAANWLLQLCDKRDIKKGLHVYRR